MEGILTYLISDLHPLLLFFLSLWSSSVALSLCRSTFATYL